MLKLKLQYFGHLRQRTDTLVKTLMLGKIEGRRRWRQRMRWLDGITNSMDMSLSSFGSCWWTGILGMLQSMGSQRVRHDCATELNWGDLGHLNVVQFSSVQLLSHVRLFATSWTAAHQASVSITNSCSLLKLMSIELVMRSPAFILSQQQGLF